MSITLELPAVLARLAGGARALPAEGSTLGDVVGDVSRRFPALAPRLRGENGELYPFVTIYLNDADVRFLGGFEAAVKEGDVVTVVPAISGG
jgi:molybdopterin converting factor small subunit